MGNDAARCVRGGRLASGGRVEGEGVGRAHTGRVLARRATRLACVPAARPLLDAGRVPWNAWKFTQKCLDARARARAPCTSRLAAIAHRISATSGPPCRWRMKRAHKPTQVQLPQTCRHASLPGRSPGVRHHRASGSLPSDVG